MQKLGFCILEDVKRAADFPFSGRRVPELTDRNGDFREMIRGNYRIVYLVEDTQITIRTIFEGHRQLSLDE